MVGYLLGGIFFVYDVVSCISAVLFRGGFHVSVFGDASVARVRRERIDVRVAVHEHGSEMR